MRKVREQYKGKELAKVLQSMRNRMDDPQLLAPDVILNMLISYRDVQVINFNLEDPQYCNAHILQ